MLHKRENRAFFVLDNGGQMCYNFTGTGKKEAGEKPARVRRRKARLFFQRNKNLYSAVKTPIFSPIFRHTALIFP
jgi:hypothetical protein